MAIEKRLINGREVGFNTETNSFCNLPKDFVDADNEIKALEDMTLDELAAYAKAKNIDIGQATKQETIVKKIKDHKGGE